ncbi:PLP-dependent aminotransferase family protein [Vreelandella piezotolerans]|uniref:PLP-dependent aminotransferase family protein n=1 Tax=Vreelandella piezotolerans TaxID=2609667 RepID=A0ABQ6XB70_9GAMM|nr:PLP-dependent aminotransferase family protein [Halomonas piezotolerans]KAE8439263.1 PLP-dependent aminotransferase family protein [Halomonas piezotolerans]QJA25218.1 PLP-dependent aminotransferase family protein [Halomonas piezotolerans]
MTIWVPSIEHMTGPRYRAIAQAIGDAIARGGLAPGEKLPPQRRLADALGVTVGTVTRGYAEAEHRGWVSARVGSGTYVKERRPSHVFGSQPSTQAGDDTIDLSLSLPPPHLLREQALSAALTTLSTSADALRRSVAYSSSQGSDHHRAALSQWLTQLGMALDAEELLITQGGQHGISLAIGTLLRPGELIAADALTYPGAISAAQQAHLKMVAIPFDQEGMCMEALAAQCARQPPRLIYLTPDQNNPTGICLSEARREQLVALARRYDIWLLEDGVQYLPVEQRGTPLYRLAPERTLFVFSTAKVLAGGLRMGVLRAPPALLERLAAALRAQSWMVPPLMVDVVCHWVSQSASHELLTWQTQELAARQQLVTDHLAGYSLSRRPNGSNVWLTLPDGVRALELCERLNQQGVKVTSAEPFCVGSAPAPQAVRICIGAAVDQAALTRALSIVRASLEQTPLATATV